jgi:hypothetical protein
MGQSWAIFRDGSGGLRLRSAKAGYNPMDLGLDRQVVTFDSSWLNSFRVRESAVVAYAGLADGSQTVGSATRDTKIIPISGSGPDRPTLAWMRDGGGTLTNWYGGPPPTTSEPMPYARGYGSCHVSMTNAQIDISPRKAGMDYVYYVFSTNPLAAEGAGAGGGLFGNHPTYGPGLYIARPGADPLTASLDDMILTTRRNHFQVQETGTTGASTHQVAGDPFPNMATSLLRSGYLVNLGRSYPDYPPVIASPTEFITSGGTTENRHLCSIFWLNSSQLMILSSFEPTSAIRWAVLTSNADYVPGTSTEVIRVAGVVGGGLYVTKKGISFPSAGAGDFLFRSDRQTPRFLGFGSIPTGAPTGITPYSLPGTPPSSGIPFTFFFAYWNGVTEWWCGCGAMLTGDFFTAGPTYYGPAFAAVANSGSQYKWYNDTSLSGGYLGAVATMNVSDF